MPHTDSDKPMYTRMTNQSLFITKTSLPGMDSRIGQPLDINIHTYIDCDCVGYGVKLN